MNIPDTVTLREAIKITTQIERLQARLHALLTESAGKPASQASKESLLATKTTKAPRRAGRKKNLKKETEKIIAPVSESAFLSLPEPHPGELLLKEDDGQEQLSLFVKE